VVLEGFESGSTCSCGNDRVVNLGSEPVFPQFFDTYSIYKFSKSKDLRAKIANIPSVLVLFVFAFAFALE